MSQDEKSGDEFLRKVVQLIFDSNIVGDANKIIDNNGQLIVFKQPKDLEEELEIVINGKQYSDEQLIELCRKVIKYSVKTSHPYFYNQLYGGIDGYSLAASWLTDALNTSQATYEIAPVFTVMENKVIKYLGGLCGWSSSDIDGIFAPGGSVSNMYGLAVARHSRYPRVKECGLRSIPGQLVAFVSEDAHYSFSKGSIWLGHGLQGVVKVKTDHRGCMMADDLDRQIGIALEQGKLPYLVAATAGTTVLGAFDPISRIADVCAKHGSLWLHVDAALGGGVLFSRTHRSLMAGIQRADSVSWNLHKLGGIPLQCSLFLTRHASILKETNSLQAEYLFQNDKYYDANYDSGDKSIQCGRKVDSLKACLALLARGQDELEAQVDKVMDMSKYIANKMADTDGFKLVLPQFQLSNICFWYLPASLRGQSEPDKGQLHKVCPAIKAVMMKEGRFMVNYQPLSSKGLPNFFRLVLTCVPEPTKEDMDAFVSQISRLGSLVDSSDAIKLKTRKHD
ncbi:Cysteine sulfinic acid decarboxylase [Halotydeus destructor]|nr:Cysteine sulfinic acid decarboxylase [Halotydeus destructor]